MIHFTMQREVTPELTVEASYSGALSHKLAYAVGNLNLGSAISKQLGIIQALYSEGNDAYHALQIKVEQRFHRSYSILVSYTYGKNLDNGPAPFNLIYNHQAPKNALNLAAERGPSSMDVRHTLAASHIWELPIGRGHEFLGHCGRLCQALAGNWQFNGITAMRSGLPANVIRDGQLTGYAGLRPNVLHAPNFDSEQRTLAHYFDTTAFSAIGLAKTQPGNAGRNLVRGPGLVNLDTSLFKSVPLPREWLLQIRFEVFNLKEFEECGVKVHRSFGNSFEGSYLGR
jgi:hypothetical protein